MRTIAWTAMRFVFVLCVAAPAWAENLNPRWWALEGGQVTEITNGTYAVDPVACASTTVGVTPNIRVTWELPSYFTGPCPPNNPNVTGIENDIHCFDEMRFYTQGPLWANGEHRLKIATALTSDLQPIPYTRNFCGQIGETIRWQYHDKVTGALVDASEWITVVSTSSPSSPVCGNVQVEAGEQCDTGGDTVDCDGDCTFVGCGDFYRNVSAGEQCDDGNTVGGDGCSPTCQVETGPTTPVCGNGVVESGEQCDDGNTQSGDGCSSSCQTEAPPPPPSGDSVTHFNFSLPVGSTWNLTWQLGSQSACTGREYLGVYAKDAPISADLGTWQLEPCPGNGQKVIEVQESWSALGEVEARVLRMPTPETVQQTAVSGTTLRVDP